VARSAISEAKEREASAPTARAGETVTPSPVISTGEFMYGMKKDELRLLPHDPSWRDDFLAERNRIAALLQDASVRIEHVGSTSIPSIHAKPILDIAMLCGGKGIEPVVQALLKLGYEYRGSFDGHGAHYYAVLDRDNVRLCQAHIYTEADADWHCKLLFRDVLRQNQELAREYEDYKLSLAGEVSDKTEYARIKTLWVDEFMPKVLSAPADAE
jgi:GrpB-like predicted nucleotidyltransferase (UPF0157 family)